ncbi:hypothetical protein ACIGBL_05640 [Streptomyces sp. NPDC085614]|uniref:hypothetical protein n=1 Tax=Streptomyces sp. NPDC085614 TaxID=3365733 RepID=UPI0037CD18AB
MNEEAWTAVSAIATAAAFLVVSWQAILTRKALDLSQGVALDAAWARLDNGAPQVSVHLEDPKWPLWAHSQHGMPCNEWPRGHQWHFPRDEWQSLVLQAVVVVENRSSRQIKGRFEGDLIVEQDARPVAAPSPVLIPAADGDTPHVMRVYLQKTLTAKELSENHLADEAGQDLPHRAVGTITLHDDRDNGVVDTWTISLTGCPLRPHENLGNVWVEVGDNLTGDPGRRSLTYERLPNRKRTYWVSRERGVPLGPHG